MHCPYCSTPHDPERDGRFCARCGMSVGPRPRRDTLKDFDPDAPPPRCAECAVILDPPDAGRCGKCGARQQGTELP